MTELQLRVAAIAEELDEIEEGVPELTGIWNHLFREHVDLATAAYPYLKEKLDLLRFERNREVPPPDPSRQELVDQLKQLSELVAKLQGNTQPPVNPAQPGQGAQVASTRSERRYRLVNVDVSRWTTKPQVVAIMDVLAAHFPVGSVFSNSEAVAAVRANKQVLGTRQDPADVWDYYKGRSADGLLQHGNIELA